MYTNYLSTVWFFSPMIQFNAHTSMSQTGWFYYLHFIGKENEDDKFDQ